MPRSIASTVVSAAAVAAGLAAFAIGVLGPAGCNPKVTVGDTGDGGDGGAGGAVASGGGDAGGNGPTTTTVASTYGPAPTSGPVTTGDPGCEEGTFATCTACYAQWYPEGAPIYKALVDCVLCGECYTSCDDAAWDCATPPAIKGACDGDVADEAACGDNMQGCIGCALAGSCADEVEACQLNQDCVDYATAIGDCPPP